MAFRRRRRESWSRLEVPRFDGRLPDCCHNSKRRSGSACQRPCTERARMRTKRIWRSLRLALLTHLRSLGVRLVLSFVDVTVAARSAKVDHCKPPGDSRDHVPVWPEGLLARCRSPRRFLNPLRDHVPDLRSHIRPLDGRGKQQRIRRVLERALAYSGTPFRTKLRTHIH